MDVGGPKRVGGQGGNGTGVQRAIHQHGCLGEAHLREGLGKALCQRVPSDKGTIVDLGIQRMVKRTVKLRVNVCDEKILLEGGRLRGKLSPRGKDEARASEHLSAIGAKRAHANNPGVCCLGVIHETAVRDRDPHGR